MCEIVDGFINQGKKEGIQLGEKKINTLNQKLLDDNRFEDLKKATSDKSYQNRLMKEYNIK